MKEWFIALAENQSCQQNHTESFILTQMTDDDYRHVMHLVQRRNSDRSRIHSVVSSWTDGNKTQVSHCPKEEAGGDCLETGWATGPIAADISYHRKNFPSQTKCQGIEGSAGPAPKNSQRPSCDKQGVSGQGCEDKGEATGSCFCHCRSSCWQVSIFEC